MNQSQDNQLKLKADDATLKGLYASAVQVQFTKEEFILDCLNMFPPVATLNARLIMSPGHVKRLAGVLADVVKKYENQFGAITEAEAPQEIGFKA
ncbi:MAG: hypothetical protein RL272_314 [Candidatus Parcubacteria bacterium]|jgi:hypothetical protein